MQIEHECLVVPYGCEKSRLYLLGREFAIYRDHKAIINILNNPRSVLPVRIERLTLILQGYNSKLSHIKGQCSSLNFTSRHPQIESKSFCLCIKRLCQFHHQLCLRKCNCISRH